MFSWRNKELTFKALNKIVADNSLICFYYFLEKIRLNISCELADDSYEMSSLIFSEKKNFKTSTAVIVIGTLRVNQYCWFNKKSPYLPSS